MTMTVSEYELQHLTLEQERAYVDGFVATWLRLERPQPDRITAWVAANYSDESKYLVANGSEATPEDQAAFSTWLHQWRLADAARRSA